MSAAKWKPADDELDGLARTLPMDERSSDRVEQERTSLLAQAAATSQQRRGSRTPVVASAVVAFAAAAAVILWLVVRPGAPTLPKESITALGPAHYERVAAWPDFRVRLDEGRIDVRVTKLAMGERFRVTTSDAEVEVRGTQFIVAAEQGKIESVSVGEGRVEIRWAHEQPIFLAAGQSWSPTKTAQRDEVQLAPSVPAHADVTSVAPSRSTVTSKRGTATTIATSDSGNTSKTSHTKSGAKPSTTDMTASQTDAKTSMTDSTMKTVPPKSPAIAPRPGEADFRSGIASLRAGDATAAVTSFASACKAAEKDALGEDACFWLGAAAKRAGQTSTAREALTRFLKTYSSSARAGEASALLGWLLYDAGELDAAQQRFELAARDRVPKVKESAERGLEAITRKRGTP